MSIQALMLNLGMTTLIIISSITKIINVSETTVPGIIDNAVQGSTLEKQETGIITEIVKNEEKKTFEEEHSDEPYIYLHNSVDIEVREDWSYVTTVQKKIKMQKSGYKSLGTIPINYVQGRDKIVSIEAYTTAPDGEKYSYSKIQDRPVYQGYKNYSDVREKIITLPKVVVGSILEHKVVTESKGKVINNAFWHTGYLDYRVPAKYDRFSISIPKALDINYREFNLDNKPGIISDEERITYTWEAKNVYKPYEEEKYSPFPTHENLTNIFQFSSIKSWSEVSDWYYEVTSGQVVVIDAINKEAEAIFEGRETLRDKVLALLEYFNENFRYISMSFGENTFEPHSTEEVFNNRYGDCKDISLLFKTMLEVGGIKSYLALFVEESLASDPQYDLPTPGAFNHVLLLIQDTEEGNFYLDPLLEGYYLEEYPLSFQGAYTFIIDGRGGRFDKMPIFDEYRLYRGKYRKYIIESDGSCECEYNNFLGLDFSINMRRKIKNMSTEKLGKMLMYIDRSHSEVLDRKWEYLNAKYGAIESHLKTREENYFPVSGDIIILNMGSYEGAGNYDGLGRENDLFYPYNSLDVEKIVFQIPDDYEVLHMPEDVELDIGFFSFRRKFKMKGNNQIVVLQEDKFRRATVPAEKGEEIGEFFEDLFRASEQRIILKRRKALFKELKEFLSRILARF